MYRSNSLGQTPARFEDLFDLRVAAAAEEVKKSKGKNKKDLSATCCTVIR
jgi:hypothetical protein